MKNYYDVLEVSRKASKDTINKIFKIHMKANHPDLFQGEEKIKAEEKSKELTEAYNVLSDDNERAKYDAELEVEESSQTNPQIESIIQENEYLKQVIAKKDEYISRLTGMNFENSNNPYNNVNYNNPYNQQYNPNYNNGGYGGFNGFTPPQPQNPYEGMSIEELKQLKKEETKQYYKNMFKEIGVKAIILALLLLVLLFSLMSSFKDLAALFGGK
ncbi:MAG: J domain-containing protein [Clostridia bacterium]